MPGALFLEGDKVNLRTVEEEDVEFIRDTYNHPEVRDQMSHRKPFNLEQEREFFENTVSNDKQVNLAISNNGNMMGMVVIKPGKYMVVAELGIWIHPEYQGNGYGKEASKLIISYAFNELRYHKIVTKVAAGNQASLRLWESLDFEEEGHFKEEFYSDGNFTDVKRYGILREEWRDN